MVELAEGTGLENRRGFTSSVGSNPTLSANGEKAFFVKLSLHILEKYSSGEEDGLLNR